MDPNPADNHEAANKREASYGSADKSLTTEDHSDRPTNHPTKDQESAKAQKDSLEKHSMIENLTCFGGLLARNKSEISGREVTPSKRL